MQIGPEHLTLPVPPLPEPSDKINQPKQDWHLDQWPDCGCKSLVATDAECRNGNRNRQLKVITSCSETLGAPKPVAEIEAVAEKQGDGENERKVDNQRT